MDKMSSICKSFESNAWRSDLCSHCFQSKEEHGLTVTSSDTKDATPSTGLGSRYQSVLNHSRSSYRTTTVSLTSAATTPTTSLTTTSMNSVSNRSQSIPATTTTPAAVAVKGVKAILKSNGNRNTKHSKSVNFPGDEDAQVIGYGGQECFESDEDETDHRNDSDEDDEDDGPFTEEERMVTFTFFFFMSTF